MIRLIKQSSDVSCAILNPIQVMMFGKDDWRVGYTNAPITLFV